MKPTRLVLLSVIVACAFAASAEPPPTAKAVLDKAKSAAAAGEKNIFLLFDASW